MVSLHLYTIFMTIRESQFRDGVGAAQVYGAPRRAHHDDPGMSFSAFKGPFEERIDTWNETLNTVRARVLGIMRVSRARRRVDGV